MKPQDSVTSGLVSSSDSEAVPMQPPIAVGVDSEDAWGDACPKDWKPSSPIAKTASLAPVSWEDLATDAESDCDFSGTTDVESSTEFSMTDSMVTELEEFAATASLVHESMGDFEATPRQFG